MIIKDKKLKDLLEKESVLLESIKSEKERVQELTAELKKIQEDNKDVLDKIAKLRKKYTKIAVPIILKSLKENEMFADIELKNGEVSYKVVDVFENLKESALKEVKKQKEDWVKYVTKKENTK